MDRPPVRPFFLFLGTFVFFVLIRWIFSSNSPAAGILARVTLVAAEPIVLLALTAKHCLNQKRIQWSLAELLAMSAAIMPGVYVSTHAHWPFIAPRAILVVWCLGYQVSGAAYVWARTHAGRGAGADTSLIAIGSMVAAWVNLAIGTMITAMVFATM